MLCGRQPSRGSRPCGVGDGMVEVSVWGASEVSLTSLEVGVIERGGLSEWRLPDLNLGS